MILDYLDRQRLVNRILDVSETRHVHSDTEIRRLIIATVAKEYSGSNRTFDDRRRIAQELFDAMRGMDVLQPLMDDPDITEIMVNGPGEIFFEHHGQIQPSDIHFNGRQHLESFVSNLYGRANRLIHEKTPLADLRLAGGERVHAALPPAAPDGPVLNIRKFTGIRQDMAALTASGFLSEEAAIFLQSEIEMRKTIFICGGTNTGKTTLLNVLSGYIPGNERLITIEDAAELCLQNHDNLVRLETRKPGPDGEGGICQTDLIRAALRMRPDRIIVGEVRGSEAYDMLHAMNTGHAGSLCTGHANSCRDMLERLCLMAMMSIELPWPVMRALVASAIDTIVHLSRTVGGCRQVSVISRVLDPDEQGFRLEDLFIRDELGGLVHAH